MCKGKEMEENINLENSNEEIIINDIHEPQKEKNKIVKYFEEFEEIGFKIWELWLKIWNRIQIKLFWLVILTIFGSAIGVWGMKTYIYNKIDEAITLGCFIQQTTIYDQKLNKYVHTTNIYEITKRIR